MFLLDFSDDVLTLVVILFELLHEFIPLCDILLFEDEGGLQLLFYFPVDQSQLLVFLVELLNKYASCIEFLFNSVIVFCNLLYLRLPQSLLLL